MLQPNSGNEFRVRSSVPFYLGLAVLSGLYVLLIVGMLVAEVVFLHPPNYLVLLVPEDNPQKIQTIEDLDRDGLRVGLAPDDGSTFGDATASLLRVVWASDVIRDRAVEHGDPKTLVDMVATGLDVALVPETALSQPHLRLIARRDLHGKADRLDLLAGQDVRIGIGDERRTAFGHRARAMLEAAGYWEALSQGKLRVAPDRETLLEWLQSGKVDAVLVADDSEAGGPQLKRIVLDVTRYPSHLAAWQYPFWWLYLKAAALVHPLAREEIRYALKLSLVSCTITTILSLWVAVPFGYLLSRFTFPGKAMVDSILDIPIVLPPLVIGLALLILFQMPPGRWFEEHVAPVTFAVPSVILAQFAVACAFAVRTMRVSFDQISPRQEQVALTLGCSRGQAFWKVVLPEARRGMITAATLAWARSLGEFGPILVFSGTTRMRTEVLPTTVFLEMSVGNVESAVAVSLLMILAAMVVLVIVRLFGLEHNPFT